MAKPNYDAERGPLKSGKDFVEPKKTYLEVEKLLQDLSNSLDLVQEALVYAETNKAVQDK